MAEMNHSTFLWQGTDASAQENEAGVSDAQKFITLKPGGKKLEYPEKAASAAGSAGISRDSRRVPVPFRLLRFVPLPDDGRKSDLSSRAAGTGQ